jgi:hypothetical protein
MLWTADVASAHSISSLSQAQLESGGNLSSGWSDDNLKACLAAPLSFFSLQFDPCHIRLYHCLNRREIFYISVRFGRLQQNDNFTE